MQDAMLALIKHFGKQKYYKLVQACCDFMYQYYIRDESIRSLQLKQTLGKIKIEAKVEQDLSLISNRWYFSIAKFFIRLRYYGVGHRASSYVKYCDDDKKYIYFDKHPDNITTDMMSGQEVYNQLKMHDNLPKLRQMKARLKEMDAPKKVIPIRPKNNYVKFFEDDEADTDFSTHQEKISQYYSI